jgi:hypothetical protein
LPTSDLLRLARNSNLTPPAPKRERISDAVRRLR